MSKFDYYEFLQISPNADRDTIHRVYRFLGARYHPDNPVSGNTEMFSKLKTAYEVLSDPMRRAEYDAASLRESQQTPPLSSSIDFMDSLEGESNRRLAVLAVLYFRRRANPLAPEVSLAEIEIRMGFPRDYLDFTTWYLQKKGYVTRADNGDFTLTVHGVDYVESQRASIPVLNRLLTDGSGTGAPESAASVKVFNPALTAEFSPPDLAPPIERRINTSDRRTGAPDRRINPVERRGGAPDRRASPNERRAGSPDRRMTTNDRRSKP